MNLLRSLAAFALLAAGGTVLRAQEPSDTTKNHVKDTINRATQHWHFEGKISTIDPGSHKITINADSIPMAMGGQTTLPYVVPKSVSLDRYHVGDRVNGDLVVSNNRSFVRNLRLGNTPAGTGTKKAGAARRDGMRKPPAKKDSTSSS